MRVVVKIGTSSITDERGTLARDVIASLGAQVSRLRADGHAVVLVSSGAVAAGLEAMKMARPLDMLTKQAVSAVGQSRLMRAWDDAFQAVGLVTGQALLTPHDFFDRTQYLHARNTLNRLLELGVVPVVNENDAIADDELRFGDNDRIAALVSHLVSADVMVLLTDMDGLYTDDPRRNPAATLIEHLEAVTPEVEALAGGTGTARGSGGMMSKVQAAKFASFSGIRAVIANAQRADVVVDAVAGVAGVGTQVAAQKRSLSARKLWIAFALECTGTITVDAGARTALIERGVSLLPAGVRSVNGLFVEGDGVDICGLDGVVFARGVSRYDADDAAAVVGRRSAELPDDASPVVVHRDDLVILV